MTQTAGDRVRWNIADLDLFPENGLRYEIIDGELLVTRWSPTGHCPSPHWEHQAICGNIYAALKA